MRVIAGLVILLSAGSTAYARLGETPAQIVARFGTCINSTTIQYGDDAGLDLQQFSKQGFTILVWFRQHASVAEDYQTHWLTEEQIKTLLSDDSEGQQWKEEPSTTGRLWVRTDGATAHLNGSEIEFKSKGLIKKQAKFTKSQKPSIDGF